MIPEEWRPQGVWYVLGKLVWVPFFRLYARLESEGRELVPRRGPLILVCNHTSALDPFALAYAMQPRRVVWLAKVQIFTVPLVTPALKKWGAVPFRREVADPAAVRGALKVLQAGQVLGLFPEATRSATGELGRVRSGAVKLALRAQVPLLPAAIRGLYQVLPRGRRWPRPGRVRVRFGAPFELAEFYGREATPEVLAAGAETIRQQIALLLK